MRAFGLGICMLALLVALAPSGVEAGQVFKSTLVCAATETDRFGTGAEKGSVTLSTSRKRLPGVGIVDMLKMSFKFSGFPAGTPVLCVVGCVLGGGDSEGGISRDCGVTNAKGVLNATFSDIPIATEVGGGCIVPTPIVLFGEEGTCVSGFGAPADDDDPE